MQPGWPLERLICAFELYFGDHQALVVAVELVHLPPRAGMLEHVPMLLEDRPFTQLQQLLGIGDWNFILELRAREILGPPLDRQVGALAGDADTHRSIGGTIEVTLGDAHGRRLAPAFAQDQKLSLDLGGHTVLATTSTTFNSSAVVAVRLYWRSATEVPLLPARGHGVGCILITWSSGTGMASLQLFGRRTSHFTRVTRIFAEELGIPYEIVPIHDMKQLEPTVYAANPALKLPTLRIGDQVIFGAENICRTLAERAGAEAAVVWPEQLRGAMQRNAQELVWHSMTAQVQILIGTLVCKLPGDNIYFEKARAGLSGAMGWLDTHVDALLESLPPSRQLSLFETTLFCQIEHLHFRKTIPVEQYSALARFAAAFATRPAAQRTPFEVDPPPN